MNNKLTKREASVASGSINDVAQTRNERTEDVLAEATVIVMLDTSGSMMGDKTTRAEEALRQIQKTFPGQVVLIEFSHIAEFRWDGLPKWFYSGTNVATALQLALEFKDLGMKFFLISDGQPSDGELSLAVAEQLAEPINTIFIGDDFDKAGQDFLQRLSNVAGGLSAGKVDPSILGNTVTQLLLGPANHTQP